MTDDAVRLTKPLWCLVHIPVRDLYHWILYSFPNKKGRLIARIAILFKWCCYSRCRNLVFWSQPYTEILDYYLWRQWCSDSHIYQYHFEFLKVWKRKYEWVLFILYIIWESCYVLGLFGVLFLWNFKEFLSLKVSWDYSRWDSSYSHTLFALCL